MLMPLRRCCAFVRMRTSRTFTMPFICLDVPCPCSFVSLAWSETVDGQRDRFEQEGQKKSNASLNQTFENSGNR